jgi:hypothetical protein
LGNSRPATGTCANEPKEAHITAILLGKRTRADTAAIRARGRHETMNKITIIEFKGYRWRKKIIKKLFVIHGKPPYVKALKLRKVWTEALPVEKGRSLASKYVLVHDPSIVRAQTNHHVA